MGPPQLNRARLTTLRAEVPRIPVSERNRLLERVTVDIFPPLHVVEEERLVLLFPEVDRTSNVKPESVLAKFGHGVRGPIVVGTGIERVVAIELPSRRVVILGSRLQNQHVGSG